MTSLFYDFHPQNQVNYDSATAKYYCNNEYPFYSFSWLQVGVNGFEKIISAKWNELTQKSENTFQSTEHKKEK